MTGCTTGPREKKHAASAEAASSMPLLWPRHRTQPTSPRLPAVSSAITSCSPVCNPRHMSRFPIPGPIYIFLNQAAIELQVRRLFQTWRRACALSA